MRLLVVEDDPDVARDLREGLSEAGFVVDHAIDGNDAWYRGGTEDYALVVLDLGLPQLDGLSILRRWREEGRTFPVLILTARDYWTEKVEGIQAGADDYLAKPFAMGELVARVRALVRRAAGLSSAIIKLGRLTLDTSRMIVLIGDRPVRVTAMEYRFLDILAHRIGRWVPVEEIAEHLHGTADAADSNAIEALVLRLRRKLGPDVIENRRGFGYALATS